MASMSFGFTSILSNFSRIYFAFLPKYENLILFEDTIYLKDVKIDSIKSSHDAPDARNFIIESHKECLLDSLQYFLIFHVYILHFYLNPKLF